MPRRKSSRRLLFLIVDVPVFYNDKFQQSKSYMFSKEPQLQFIEECWTSLLCNGDVVPTGATVHKTDLIPQVQFLGKVVAPVLCNDRCVV